VRFEQLRNPQDIRRVLDVFFKQKSARMHALGIPDAFSSPRVRRFIEAAATETLPDGEPLIELYALTVGDIIVATLGAMVGGGRFCGMFNSIVKDRYAAESPGEQLLAMLVRSACERGLATFDLGIGRSQYKSLFCDDAEPLFDTYLPLSGGGRVLAFALAALAALKRAIKQHAALWWLARTLRRLRAQFSDAI
jgi:CelD/BcsL family acetyltransferase involved in cellulose biosynthesis